MYTNQDDLRHLPSDKQRIYESSLQVPTLLNSGLVRSKPPEWFGGKIQGGGQTLVVDLPLDLEGDAEPYAPGRTITPAILTSISQRIAVFDRQKDWSIGSIGIQRIGVDTFMNDLRVKFGHWLAQQFEKEVTALLKGVFGPLRRTNTQNTGDYALGSHTIDAEHDDSPTIITPDTICQARDRLGQFSNRLKRIVVHSDVRPYLPPDEVLCRQGLKVVVSDVVGNPCGCNTTYYATYISAPDVIITAEKPRLVYEQERIHVTFSWSDIVHVNGVTWKGDDRIIDGLPRCQLARATNWELVDKPRNVPIVRITTTVPAS